jgi:hypothetical protein
VSKTDRPECASALRFATDETVKLPLWDFSPGMRLAVLHERARRFGIPTTDDFDPEFH